MGNYTYFVEEDLDISDVEGLKVFLVHWEKTFPNCQSVKLTEFPMATRLKARQCYTAVSFEKHWNDIKLISYWYPYQIVFLKCIAKYIHGSVKFIYEDDENYAKVYFSDGNCQIVLGEMKWNDYNPDLWKDFSGGKEWEKLKEVMILNNL